MAAERKRLVKLVRDRVAQFIGEDTTVLYAPVGNHELHVQLLRAKLVEEAAEYLLDPSVGEAADVLEVLGSLIEIDLGVPWLKVQEAAKAKYRERGGFEEGTAMYTTTTAPATHEGNHGG